jgi:hypothetical protein
MIEIFCSCRKGQGGVIMHSPMTSYSLLLGYLNWAGVMRGVEKMATADAPLAFHTTISTPQLLPTCLFGRTRDC